LLNTEITWHAKFLLFFLIFNFKWLKLLRWSVSSVCVTGNGNRDGFQNVGLLIQIDIHDSRRTFFFSLSVAMKPSNLTLSRRKGCTLDINCVAVKD
jgi:hypothetical protein